VSRDFYGQFRNPYFNSVIYIFYYLGLAVDLGWIFSHTALTEFDKNAGKAVLFATRSRREIEDLGVKADRAVTFLKTLYLFF
jgi:hypothetical protein